MRTQRQLLAETKASHNHPAYAKLEFLMGCGVQSEGVGSRVRDARGKEFLALFDQYGNQSFGFSNPRIVGAIEEQLASRKLNSVKTMFEEEFIVLTERLSRLTGDALPYASISNSGAEAIETALKLARGATGRRGVVSATDSFHGKTFGALSASGRAEHRSLVGPLLDHFRQVPFGDLAALEAAVDDDTAAVLLEPVQAEGGVVVPPADYLRAVRELCTRRGAMLVVDEMQTGFGRCGTFFAYERSGVLPDLVCIGKAFGGGMVPVSAVLGTAAAWRPFEEDPSAFGTSLGGNPLCCRVGLEAVAIASDPGFLAAVRERSAVLQERLAALPGRFPGLLREHRGLGMMHGLEFHDASLAGLCLGLLYDRGVMSAYALYNSRVVRVQPPLTISEDDLARGLDVLEEALRETEGHRLAGAEAPAADDNEGQGEGQGEGQSVTVTQDLPFPAGDVRALLAGRPRLIDPFAVPADAEGAEGAGGEGAEGLFRGTLGDDLVVWRDRAEVTAEGVLMRAEPDWLWRTLERAVTVRPAEGAACTVEVRVAWNAGLGPLEAICAARLRYFVTRRLSERLAELKAVLG